MAARQKLRAAYRGGVEIIHGIPLLVSGVNDGAAAAAIGDFFFWLKQVATGRNINLTLDLFVTKLPGFDEGLTGTGTPLAPGEAAASPSAAVPYRIMLPSDLSGRNNAVFELKHKTDAHIMPFPAEFCDVLLSKLASELNAKYMANLADPLRLEQWHSDLESDGEDDNVPTLILVGGSHASRMAEAAEALGYAVVDLSRPGLRITEDIVEELAAELRDLWQVMMAMQSLCIICTTTMYISRQVRMAPEASL
jgi:hypothetical protein